MIMNNDQKIRYPRFAPRAGLAEHQTLRRWKTFRKVRTISVFIPRFLRPSCCLLILNKVCSKASLKPSGIFSRASSISSAVGSFRIVRVCRTASRNLGICQNSLGQNQSSAYGCLHVHVVSFLADYFDDLILEFFVNGIRVIAVFDLARDVLLQIG